MTLLSTADAAFAAGVAKVTIRQWGRRGRIRRFGSPGRALWAIDDLARVVVP